MTLEATPADGMPEITDPREARRLLARMERMEEFAQKYEQIDTLYPDVPKWELECQRRNFAETYHRLLGVLPENRSALRSRLVAASI